VLFAEILLQQEAIPPPTGAVTYQTAYLQGAAFPVAYIGGAAPTVNAGSTDKVQRYIANCQAMGIEVMPPDPQCLRHRLHPNR